MAGSTINQLVTNSVTLGSSSYLSPLTITSTGTVAPNSNAGDTAVIATIQSGSLLSQGLVIGGFGPNGGIGVDLANGSLHTTGSIVGGGAYAGGSGGSGVEVNAGTVINTRQISGGAGGNYAIPFGNGGNGGDGGVGLTATGGIITNVGTITGGSGGRGSSDPEPASGGTGGGGVALSSGSQLINTGEISGGGAGYMAGIGGVFFSEGGVGVTAMNSTASNKGMIVGGYGFDGRGADLNSNSVLINDGIIEGGASSLDAYRGATGVKVDGGSSLSNNGTIRAGGGNGAVISYGGIGVDVLSGTVTNSGSIFGAYSLAGQGVGVLFENGGTLTNSGLIAGGSNIGGSVADAVKFEGGNARLILEPGASLVGGAVADASFTNVLELARGPNSGTIDIGNQVTGFGTVTVDANANWTIDAPTSSLAGTRFISRYGRSVLMLTNAGTFSLGTDSDIGTIQLAAGDNTFTMPSGTTGTLFDGASGNNNVSVLGDMSPLPPTLYYFTGSGTDHFSGGTEVDVVSVSAGAVSGDTLTGGTAHQNTLLLTSAGTFSLGQVSRFAMIKLASGDNSVTLTDTTLSGGLLQLFAGPNGNDIVSAADDTMASAGKTLAYYCGTGKFGTDIFTGGAETDVVRASSSAVSNGDTLTGGSAMNTLVLTLPGVVDLSHVSHFAVIDLASSGVEPGLENIVTVTDTTLSGGSIQLFAGANGDDLVDAESDTGASVGKTLSYYAGNGYGTDYFNGGAETDVVRVSADAVHNDVLTGGTAQNTLVLTTAGTVDLTTAGHFAMIDLASGDNEVFLGDSTLSGGSIQLFAGASGNNFIISYFGEEFATVTYYAGSGTDDFQGGDEADIVKVSAGAVSRDTFNGGFAQSTLVLTSAGTFSVGHVSNFDMIDLASGDNVVDLTDTTLSGGSIQLFAGASGNDVVSAAGDTRASAGTTIAYYAGSGTDVFTGGTETDVVRVSAEAVSGDTLTGGAGQNTLVLTSAGTFSVGRASHFAMIKLASGDNSVALTDTTLSGGSLQLFAGASGNDVVSAVGDTAASAGTTISYYTGSGTNQFTGGVEDDIIYIGGGSGLFTAGAGHDTLAFLAANLSVQTLDNFQSNLDHITVFGTHAANGFDLGSSDDAMNPADQTLIDPSIFVANATGTFTSTDQRFAYDTANGDLYYSASAIGSAGSEKLVATLSGAPSMTAHDIFFQH